MRNPKIIFYHSIKTSANARPPKCYGPTIEQFREQMQYLKAHYSILDIEEIIDCCRSGRFPQERSAAITFDDGLATVMLAAEVLTELKLPAMVFLSSRFIDSSKLPWFVHLDDLIIEATRRRKLLRVAGQEFGIDTRSSRKGFRQRAKMLLLQHPYDKQLELLSAWAEGIGWKLADGCEEEEATFLTWNQIAQLAGSGICFGSHTHSHVDLRVLSDQELEAEFVKPVRLIGDKVGAKHCQFVSYPDGRFDQRVLSAAKRYHQAAFAVVQSSNWHDAYRLPRRCIELMLGMYSDGM